MIEIENLNILFSSFHEIDIRYYTHLISNGLVLYCHLGAGCLNPCLETGIRDEKTKWDNQN